MRVSTKGVELKPYMVGAGVHTLKIISVVDGVTKKGNDFITMTCVNSKGAIYKENFFIENHIDRLKRIANACNVLDTNDEFETIDLIGCYFKATIDVLKYSDTGEYSDRYYIQDIQPLNRRRDTSGSSKFGRKEIAYEMQKNRISRLNDLKAKGEMR